jgi:hypothetical protein
MSTRTASWLAWSLAALSVAMFVASIALYILISSAPIPSDVGSSRTLIDALTLVPALAFPVVGALIASRRPRNPIGWICLADGFLWMFLSMIDYYGVYGLAKPGSVPFPMVIYALGQWLWVPTLGLLSIYLVLLFPDGRLPSMRWRPLAWFSGVVIVLVSVTQGLIPGPLPEFGGVRNPFGLEGQPWIEDVSNAIFVPFLLCILASVVSLVLRYRRSGGEVRQQIKWVAFAGSFLGLVFVSVMAISLIHFFFAPETWEGAAQAPPFWLTLLFYVMLLSFGGVPIAVGFAVLKYRLYNIDLIINRTLVYSSLTALLAAVYFGLVTATQAIFRSFTSQEQPQLVIVISTLVIAALFNPLRRRIQSFIDRRFYRRTYDAAKTLEDFTAKLRDETDLDALSGDVVGVVRETMQPAHVSLWLRPERPRRGSEGPE